MVAEGTVVSTAGSHSPGTIPEDTRDWTNRLLQGDNLGILKALRDDPLVYRRVRLVYIDPPFASSQEFRTSQDRVSTISRPKNGSLAYSDKVVGKDYLQALRLRLERIRDLMALDASIYVHIDHKMHHRVRQEMDRVFGQDNFVNSIVRIKCNPKNFERKGFGNIWDSILFYAKSKEFQWNGSRKEYSEEQFERLFPLVGSDGRRYTTNPLHAPGETTDGPTGRPWRGISPPRGRHWRYPPEMLEELDREGRIVWSSTGNPRKKIYADEQRAKLTKRQDVWEFKDPPYPDYPTEKNLDMLEVIIEASSREGDLVLDAYCGSGTTLVAAERLHRRWIGIDRSLQATGVARDRLKNARFSFETLGSGEQTL